MIPKNKDMNRKIYITLGILINIVEITLPVILFSGWGILIAYLLLLAYLIGTGAASFSNDYCPITFWFWSSDKKIYHDGFGILYSSTPTTQGGIEWIHIYKQRWLYQVEITKVEYTDNLHTLVIRTKMMLDDLYQKENAEKNKKTAFEEWDGYLDTQSKRDDKLNKLGVK
jgi:hypothetical protein